LISKTRRWEEKEGIRTWNENLNWEREGRSVSKDWVWEQIIDGCFNDRDGIRLIKDREGEIDDWERTLIDQTISWTLTVKRLRTQRTTSIATLIKTTDPLIRKSLKTRISIKETTKSKERRSQVTWSEDREGGIERTRAWFRGRTWLNVDETCMREEIVRGGWVKMKMNLGAQMIKCAWDLWSEGCKGRYRWKYHH